MVWVVNDYQAAWSRLAASELRCWYAIVDGGSTHGTVIQ